MVRFRPSSHNPAPRPTTCTTRFNHRCPSFHHNHHHHHHHKVRCRKAPPKPATRRAGFVGTQHGNNCYSVSVESADPSGCSHKPGPGVQLGLVVAALSPEEKADSPLTQFLAQAFTAANLARAKQACGLKSLAYKRPVVDGLKSVFSGFTKLYGIITD
jgi:hypothetical protein